MFHLEVKIIKDNYVTKTHLEELKKDKSFLKTSTSPAHHHKVGRRCSAFLLDVGTTFGDSGPMGLSHELSTADVPLQTTDVQTETEKIAIAQVASRARDSVDALAPVSDMHKADLFTSGGVTAYNGADGRQSFSAGGAKTTPIPMQNSPSKSRMNDDKTIVVNKFSNNNNAIKDTSCDDGWCACEEREDDGMIVYQWDNDWCGCGDGEGDGVIVYRCDDDWCGCGDGEGRYVGSKVI
ncbi:unnamed protein product [Parnassius apollo]|uniref:(apollo) hypothetical protein n=1 Tax=Parnassius apollo TaxID=110799 RepID=A0A8S3WCN6_PARAO|nr:unnamed protein product [Parnassius apollo]